MALKCRPHPGQVRGRFIGEIIAPFLASTNRKSDDRYLRYNFAAMAKATSCLIDVDLALRLRKQYGPRFSKANFSCRKCGRAVKPIVENPTGVAHFEHYERNIDCPLSDKRPIRKAYAASKT